MINKIVELLKQEKLVDITNEQIIMVGLQKLGNTVIDFFFAIFCAGVLGDIVVGIFFELGYRILRIYAGGYHAKDKKVCTWLTYVSTLFSIAIAFLVPVNWFVICFLLIILISIIAWIAPVESVNKPLNNMERKVFYRYCMGITLMEALLCCAFIYFDLELYAGTISISMLLVVIGLLAALKGNHRRYGGR